MTYQARNGTGGLASPYQVTQTTGAYSACVPDTAGNISVGAFIVLRWLELPATPQPSLEKDTPADALALQMARNKSFYELTERGRAEIDQGLCFSIEDIKRQLGDV